MKILVISRNAWNDSANNTLSNIFKDFHNDEFANIFCRDEVPSNNICFKYYKISERILIAKILSKFFLVKSNKKSENKISSQISDRKIYSIFRNYRFTIFLWIREIIWKSSIWKNDELINFINDFRPEIIYSDAYDTIYTYDIALYAMNISKAPLVLFHSDDHASFHKFSLSPLYWINRILVRKKIGEISHLAKKNYFIINGLGLLYNKIFKIKPYILTKCYDFNDENNLSKESTQLPVKLLYAGNLIYGRYKSLKLLADVINEINAKDNKFTLNIYTNTILSKKEKDKLSSCNGVFFHGSTSFDNVQKLIKESDIVIHVESLELKQKLITAYSFSTKIVDYLHNKKCILAIGWSKSLSIKYISENSIGITASNKEEILKSLNLIYNNLDIINTKGIDAFNYGKIHHNSNIILNDFKKDLVDISKSYWSDSNLKHSSQGFSEKDGVLHTAQEKPPTNHQQ